MILAVRTNNLPLVPVLNAGVFMTSTNNDGELFVYESRSFILQRWLRYGVIFIYSSTRMHGVLPLTVTVIMFQDAPDKMAASSAVECLRADVIVACSNTKGSTFSKQLQEHLKALEVGHIVITPQHYPLKPIEALCGVFILESTPKKDSKNYQTVVDFQRRAVRLFIKLMYGQMPMTVVVVLMDNDVTAKYLADFDLTLAQRAQVVQSTLGSDRIASYIHTEILGRPLP